MKIVGFDVVDEKTVGEGGFLRIRRLMLRLVREDNSRSAAGVYDYVERPVGLDAVVLALYARDADGGAVRVLLRDGLRVPLYFGRGGAREGVPALHAEVVAGILETGEDSEDALRERAAAEALEEAGVTVAPALIQRLGAATFPTAGMCAELFHFVCAEVPPAAIASARVPEGDGSPFEEGAALRWLPLDEAIAACARGDIPDMKTELALRRLREKLG
jgi:ADP-ribose diphosphatase